MHDAGFLSVKLLEPWLRRRGGALMVAVSWAPPWTRQKRPSEVFEMSDL